MTGEPKPWNIVWTKAALKDRKLIELSPYVGKAKAIVATLKANPYKTPPAYEKLVGDFEGAYSRRINIQHRVVYQVLDTERTVKILCLWGHY
jgi:Txe/YoeB family toxin of toxin-antitoxin system